MVIQLSVMKLLMNLQWKIHTILCWRIAKRSKLENGHAIVTIIAEESGPEAE